MKHYLNILIAILLTAFMACTDSKLEDWEPYLSPSRTSESSLSVDKTNIRVNDSFSSQSIAITSTDPWTASTSDSWISLSATSGSSSQTITVKIEENNTSSQRTGKVIISIASGNAALITITQDGKTMTVDPSFITFKAEGGTQSINIETNGSYSWNKNEISSWLTVTQGYGVVYVKASANISPEQRSDTLTLFMTGLAEGDNISHDVVITQFGSSGEAPVVSTSNISISSAAFTQDIAVTSIENWTASKDAPWITLSSSSGSGSSIITISIEENRTISSRSDIITIQNILGSAKVAVTQEGKYLTVFPENLTFESNGGSETVTVDTDGTFDTSVSDDWIAVSTSDSIINVSTSANSSDSKRTGTVTVSLTNLSMGILVRTISVTQNGVSVEPPTVSRSDISVTSTACTESLLITSSFWTATKDADWIELSSTSGSNNANVTLSIAENKTPSSRIGTITVQNSAGSTQVIVTQAGKYLSVSTDSITFDADGGSTIVTVDTDGTYSCSKSDYWISYSKSGNSITIHADPNTSNDIRSGKVTVTLTGLSSGSLSTPIIVNQNAKVGVSIDDYGDLKPLD